MEYLSDEEYEEMKIQEAVEIAEKIEKGEIETIPFEEAMKQIDDFIKGLNKENKGKIIAEGEEEYIV